MAETIWDLAALCGKGTLVGIGFASGAALVFWLYDLINQIRTWYYKRKLKKMSRWS